MKNQFDVLNNEETTQELTPEEFMEKKWKRLKNIPCECSKESTTKEKERKETILDER